MEDKFTEDIKVTKQLSNWLRTNLSKQTGFVLLISVLVAYIATPKWNIMEELYQEGDIARENIKASRDYIIIDNIATEIERQKAEKAVKPVYDYDENAGILLTNRVKTAFNLIGEKQEEVANQGSQKIIKQNFDQFRKILNINLEDNILARIKQIFFGEYQDFFPYFLDVLSDHVSKLIVLDNVLPTIKQEAQITVRKVLDQKNIVESDFSEFGHIKSVSEIDKQIYDTLMQFDRASKFSKKRLAALKSLIKALITVNLVYNAIETNLRKKKARDEVKALKFNIKNGEMIIRDGERINAKTIQILEQIKKAKSNIISVLIFLGISAFLFILLYTTLVYAQFHLVRFHVDNRDLIFLTSVLLLSCITFSLWKYVASVINAEMLLIPLKAYYYCIPFAFGGMLVRSVKNSVVAMIFSVLVSILAGLVMDADFYFAFYAFVGSLIGSSGVAKCLKRSTLTVAGLKIGLANVFLVLAITLITDSAALAELSIIYHFVAALLGGVLAGVIVTGLTPIVETVFDYVTDFQLLELSNMNHPVMKELIIHAPGTYAHSIIVGSLVEAAAEDIGANPLLCRVASYYHDIGKIKKPQYFVENQVGVNKHDKLSPRLSSLIITAHVKDGVEIAKSIGLCKPILDIIKQHHGTSRMDYFFKKAIQKGENEANVIENDFRYPGPKPQTREAGLVHLADMVQASAQSISEKSPARLQGLIQKVINKAFTSGQLDECDLTLRDLHKVAKAFYRIFGGIYHYRVDYLDKITKGEQKKVINMVTNAMLNAPKQGDPKEDLKRLGQDAEKMYGQK